MAAFNKFDIPVVNGTVTAGRGTFFVIGGGLGLSVTTVVGSANHVTVSFSGGDPVLTGSSILASNWLIAGLTVTAAVAVGSTVVLTTSEQLIGATYTLLIPQGVAMAVTGLPNLGPFVRTFTGVGSSPGVLIGRAVEARIIEVTYSEPVIQSDAETVANYSVNLGITVTKASKVTDLVYRLTTAQASRISQSYTVTISNVRDLSGNIIA